MVGNALTYTLIVTNSGPLTATGVILTSTLPAGVNVISRATTQGSCGQANLIVTCTLGAINNGANAVVTVIITPTIAAVGVITHEATVRGNEPDPAPFNNNATQSTTINPLTADLRLLMTDAPDPVIERSPLTYTLVITNVGPATATGIKITDTLPASVNFITATTSQGTCAHRQHSRLRHESRSERRTSNRDPCRDADACRRGRDSQPSQRQEQRIRPE
jgi:uncharacterized repeat protein (TIGR01451 family)